MHKLSLHDSRLQSVCMDITDEFASEAQETIQEIILVA